MIFLLSLFLSLINISTVVSLESREDSFWLSASFTSMEWKRGCLKAAGCTDPRLSLTLLSLLNNEKQSSSWPVSENMDLPRDYVTHWIKGAPNDVTIGCEVSGIDPTYGFTRTCDSTPIIRIIAESIDKHSHSSQTTGNDDEKMIIELKGKCLNATLTVQKYSRRCPWCPKVKQVEIVERYPESEVQPDFLAQIFDPEQFVSVGLISLSALAITCSAAFTCLLIVFLRQKREVSAMLEAQKSVIRSTSRANLSRMCATTVVSENGYETPWDAVRRPPQASYWLTSKYRGVISPPIDTSLIMDGIASGRGTNIEGYYSQVGEERHDDSGHESV